MQWCRADLPRHAISIIRCLLSASSCDTYSTVFPRRRRALSSAAESVQSSVLPPSTALLGRWHLPPPDRPADRRHRGVMPPCHDWRRLACSRQQHVHHDRALLLLQTSKLCDNMRKYSLLTTATRIGLTLIFGWQLNSSSPILKISGRL